MPLKKNSWALWIDFTSSSSCFIEKNGSCVPFPLSSSKTHMGVCGCHIRVCPMIIILFFSPNWTNWSDASNYFVPIAWRLNVKYWIVPSLYIPAIEIILSATSSINSNCKFCGRWRIKLRSGLAKSINACLLEKLVLFQDPIVWISWNPACSRR